MTTPEINDYRRVGKEWPIYLHRSDVDLANQSQQATPVFPQHIQAPMSLGTGLERPSGYVGVPLIGGDIDLDHNSNLDSYSWRGSYDNIGIVDQMVREDPVAQAIKLAWTLPLLSVQWSIEPGSDDPKDVEIAEFVQSALFEHLSGGWHAFLEQAVSFTWRGLSAFEIVARYDKELGATVIDQLSPRLPWTIYQWQRYKDGRYGFQQWPDPADPPVGGGSYSRMELAGATLKPDQLLMFTFQPEGNNPEPMGILRPAYSAWRQRRTYLKLEATGYERAAYGVPYVEVEPGANPADVDQVNIILRELRAGIRAFAMFPRGFKLQWSECPMKAAEIREARIAAGVDMARAALSQFLFTGESAGAYSLIQGQLDHYTMALQQAANSIATTLSQGPHALVKRLVAWNYPGVNVYPYVQAGEVRVGDPKQLVEAIKMATEAGIVMPDALIESKVRDVLSLPERLDKGIPADPEDSPEPKDDLEPPPTDETAPPPPAPAASQRGEEPAGREEEGVAARELPLPFSLADRPVADRVEGDIFVEGPRGRAVRPEEGCIRYSETVGATLEAKEKMALTISEWRAETAPDYAKRLAEKKTIDEMLEVEVPDQDKLEKRLVEQLRDIYEVGQKAVEGEVDRQEKDESLRPGPKKELAETPFHSHNCPGCLFGGEEHSVALAKKIKAPPPAPDEPPSEIDDIDPEDSVVAMARTATRTSADRLRQTTVASIQDVGIGGMPPALAVVEAVAIDSIRDLSVGPDLRISQRVTNSVYGLGRMQELRAEGVLEYQYTNLAESESCDPCLDHDQDTFGADELAFYATPADWCEGGAMCNCLVIGLVE